MSRRDINAARALIDRVHYQDGRFDGEFIAAFADLDEIRTVESSFVPSWTSDNVCLVGVAVLKPGMTHGNPKGRKDLAEKRFPGIRLERLRRDEVVRELGLALISRVAVEPNLQGYPLMQNALSQYMPVDQYVTRLAASGVDIIYPGGRPDIGGMVRSLQGAGEGNHVRPVQRYKKLMEKGWPMLSVAGGIYPGQMQAFYELLGPDVAWFVGGGVALHKDGPRAGAALCVKIAHAAAANRAKAGRDWSVDISESLSEQADTMFKDRSLLSEDQLRYVSPQLHLSKVYGLAPYGN